MSDEEIIQLWEKANSWDISGWQNTIDDLKRFVKLIQAHKTEIALVEAYEAGAEAERELCAKLCDKQANDLWQKNCDSEGHGADQCATAIRARGQE